jgi:mono/diheme cytochrome c family protein
MKSLSFFLIASTVLLLSCNDSKSPSPGGPAPTAPAELAGGEKLFNNNCAACHGIGAKGTDRGPTFLSKIYEPNHHADVAFRMAPQNGVRAHHWNFGDMPKIGVSPEELNEIIPYIRWLQRQTGIF